MAEVVEAGVVGPHTRERLANVPYDILNGSRSDLLVAGCKSAGAVSVSKDLKEDNGIFDVAK